jgi:hypothetical protein
VGLPNPFVPVQRDLLCTVHCFAIPFISRLLSRLRRPVGRFDTELLGVLRVQPLLVAGETAEALTGKVLSCRQRPERWQPSQLSPEHKRPAFTYLWGGSCNYQWAEP